jgi:hypothetical protein
MNLPEAPIAQKGFFAAHFFTVKDQEKSEDSYIRILGRKLIKPADPCYIKLENAWIILNCGGGPTPDRPEVVLETHRIWTEPVASLICVSPASGPATRNGRQKSVLSYRTITES